MTKTKFLFLSTAIIFLSSCGQSKEQQAADEKRKMDSTATATKNEIVRSQFVMDSIKTHDQAMKDSIKQTNEINQARTEVEKSTLIELKGRLAAEESKMQDIQSFQLGRAHSEKEQQIASQTKVIESLKLKIADIEKELAK